MHGDFSLSVEGRVLISRIRGPLNEEFARQYVHAVTPVARELGESGPWGAIAIYEGSALFPLEMSAILRRNAIIAAEQLNMAANSWVIPPSVEGYGIVDKQARIVYRDVFPFEVFDNIDDAHAWLAR